MEESSGLDGAQAAGSVWLAEGSGDVGFRALG